MVQSEVLTPIGIHQARRSERVKRAVRGSRMCNAGYYPTLDDLAKIALLYQARGAHGAEQILNRELTTDLLKRARRHRQECGCIARTRRAPVAGSTEAGCTSWAFTSCAT